MYKASEVETYLIGASGEPFGKTKLDYADGEWRQFVWFKDDGDFKPAKELTGTVKSRYNLTFLGKVKDEPNYYIGTDKFTDKISVYLYNLDTDTISSEPVVALPDFNITGLVFDIFEDENEDNKLLGFTYDADVSKTYWIDRRNGRGPSRPGGRLSRQECSNQ